VNHQENTLVAVARLLDKHGLPYMVIGGMANAVWGVPRSTLESRRDQLDQAYLEPRVRELVDLLEKPEILARFSEWST